jgi:hypothetical protein
MVTFPSGAIPNRWLSASRHVGPSSASARLGVISLGLRLKGCAAKGTTRLWRRLRWGRSTDAEGDGDVRPLWRRFPCTDRLDKRFFIDGLFSGRPFGTHVTRWVQSRVRLAAGFSLAWAPHPAVSPKVRGVRRGQRLAPSGGGFRPPAASRPAAPNPQAGGERGKVRFGEVRDLRRAILWASGILGR